MSITDTAAFTVTPLSEFQPPGGLRSFLDGLLYPALPGREDRFVGDTWLLDALEQELRKATTPRQPMPRVGELPASVVQAVVDELERTRYPTWRLDGEAGEDIFARLDRHFAAAQQGHAAMRQQRVSAALRYSEQSAALDADIAARDEANDRVIWDLPPAA